VNLLTTMVRHPFSKLVGYFNFAQGLVELEETNPTHDHLVLNNLLNDSCSSFRSKTISIFDLSIDNVESLTLKHLYKSTVRRISLFRGSTLGSTLARTYLTTWLKNERELDGPMTINIVS
jgi:hypothetical protein